MKPKAKSQQLPGIPEIQQTDLDRKTVQKALQALRASLLRSAARHAQGTALRAAFDAETASVDRLIERYDKETGP